MLQTASHVVGQAADDSRAARCDGAEATRATFF